MGLLGKLLDATFEVVTSPIAVIKDIENVVDGEVPDETVKQAARAVDDIGDGIKDLSKGDLI